MKRDEITSVVLRLLNNIAPEVDLDEIDRSEDLREEMDIDSMDFLNFIIALSKELAVEVPEIDYPQLSTLDDCVGYIETRLAVAATT